MRRNKESKYRIKIICSNHLKKDKQVAIDSFVEQYGLSYKDIYQVCVMKDIKSFSNIANIVVDKNLSALHEGAKFAPLDDFVIPDFKEYYRKPYYLCIDFADNADMINKINYKGK